MSGIFACPGLRRFDRSLPGVFEEAVPLGSYRLCSDGIPVRVANTFKFSYLAKSEFNGVDIARV
jgi:hypothetical protein